MGASYWTNDDGLVVRFGGVQDQEDGIASHVVTAGVEQQVVLDIADATTITAATAPTQITNGAFIPANSVVKSVEVYVDTAFTSGGLATLEVGSYQSDGTVIDKDGFLTEAVAGLTADTLVTESSINDASIAQDSYVAVTYGTAAFTAGSGKVVITYVGQ